MGLGRSLLEAFPGEPEVGGLLALLSLHDARRRARFDASGEPVPLPEQDRTRWDREAISDATALLERSLEAQKPGPFQIEAAISAVHCRAPSADATDWVEIASLYALLEPFRATPAVRVNRAFAVARAHGPAAGIALLDDAVSIDVDGYPYVHLVRGTLLAELGHIDEATTSLRMAHERARNEPERAQISQRLAELASREQVR